MISEMADNAHDVFVTSALNDDPVIFSLWNLKTGTLIKSFKGGQQQGCHRLARSGSDYVLTSQENKQLINVWDWKKDQAHMRIVCPEKISAICCTPDGNYCLVALLDKICVWQMATGNLMRILSKHYQNITCLKFTDCGSHFVSAGDDNLVMVWSLSSVLCPVNTSSGMLPDHKPVHTWSHHSLPVKDIFLTSGGIRCRVLTCSLDQTCKLYDMASGIQLCSLLFETGLSAVTMGAAESLIFVGGVTGKINAINLSSVKIQNDQNIVNDEVEGHFFGHSKEITALTVSSDGETLLSASADHTVRVWHIKSGQCIKQISFKGKVKNLEVLRLPDGLTDQASSKQSRPISNFKRNLFEPSLSSGISEDLIPVILNDVDKSLLISCQNKKSVSSDDEEEENALIFNVIQEIQSKQVEEDGAGSKDVEKMDRNELVERVKQLESLARTLYGFSAKRIINDTILDGNK